MSERVSADVCVVAQGPHANAWVVVRECGEDYTPCSRRAEVCVVAVVVEVRWRRWKRGGGKDKAEQTAGGFVLGCKCEGSGARHNI